MIQGKFEIWNILRFVEEVYLQLSDDERIYVM